MFRLKKVIISSLLCLPALFLFSGDVFAACTNFQPSNPGAAQAYPVACADRDHWCSSSQECAFNQYDTAPASPPTTSTGAKTSPRGNCAESEINTALGCISTDLAGGGLTRSILRLAIGLGGAGALIMMLYGFYILTTSAGIPDKVKAGQEVITSAVGGLLFIIFAVVLMQLIGVQILQLPGL